MHHRLHLGHRPRLGAVPGGIEAGHFGEDIGKARGALEQLAPRLEGPRADGRLGEMVDNDGQVRVALAQLRHVLEMPGQHGHEVERHLRRLQHAQARRHFGAEHPVGVGAHVDAVAHAGETVPAHQLVEHLLSPCGVVQREPRHHTGHLSVLVGDLEHGLVVLGEVAALDHHRRLDAGGVQVRVQIGETVLSVELGEHGLEPRVVEPARVPEMLVGIDNGQRRTSATRRGPPGGVSPGRVRHGRVSHGGTLRPWSATTPLREKSAASAAWA